MSRHSDFFSPARAHRCKPNAANKRDVAVAPPSGPPHAEAALRAPVKSRSRHAARPLAQAAPVVQLRILATTDLHGQILPYDYFSNQPQYGQGLAQTAHLIAKARAAQPQALLLDNGDFLQGSAMVERAAQSHRRRRPHPAIAAFNMLGYDAVALGNHEFSYGLDLLQEALRDASFAVVSGNVAVEQGATAAEDRHLVAPYALLHRDLPDASGRRHRITIGVLGLTPPQILLWDHHHLAGRLSVRPMVETARTFVPLMRAAGADVVICLAHTGIYSGPASSVSCAEATEIAAIAGVDALVAGHSHLVFPPRMPPGGPAAPQQELSAGGGAAADDGQQPGNPPEIAPEGRRQGAGISPAPELDPRIDPLQGRLAGKPCVQPGHSGTHLGVIDLWLEQRPQGWQVSASQVTVQNTSEEVAALPRPALRRLAAPLRAVMAMDHRATLAWLRRRIAVTRIPLNTHFSTLIDDQATRLIAAALSDHVRRALANGPFAALPVVAAVTPFRNGGWGGPLNFTDIPVGPLNLRNIYDLYPYPNRLIAKLVTGRDLRARLERATALYSQLEPGKPDQLLLDPAIPGFSYEILSGLSYRIDLSRPHVSRHAAAQRQAVLDGVEPGRIVDLRRDGHAVFNSDRFVLVTNSYLSAEGLNPTSPVLLDDRSLCADVIARWASQQVEIQPQTGPGWALQAPAGTSVIFQCGAGALAHLSDIAAMRPEPLGLTHDGFHRLRLQL